MTRLQQVFAKNLKYYRDRLGYSQAVLAEKAGISLNFLSLIEIARKFPSPENIENLAATLGVKPFHLFVDAEPDTVAEDPMLTKYLSESLVDKTLEAVVESAKRMLGGTN